MDSRPCSGRGGERGEGGRSGGGGAGRLSYSISWTSWTIRGERVGGGGAGRPVNADAYKGKGKGNGNYYLMFNVLGFRYFRGSGTTPSLCPLIPGPQYSTPYVLKFT